MKTGKSIIKGFALFVLTFFCLVFAGNAQDFEIDIDGVLVKYTGPGGDVVVPSGVTAIGDSAFSGCGSLTSITLPSGVTSIGDSAFEYCSSLKSITIPSGVTSIGISAFYWCDSLRSIMLPSSVTSIGGSAFGYCISLRSITIPSGVTSINGSTFMECGSLTSVTLPSTVTSIGDGAFVYCSSLTSITIPSGVTSIGSSAFAYCSSLTSITIPSSVTSIGNWAFEYCSSLTSITLPSSVTSIGSGAFPDSTWDSEHNGQWYSMRDRAWFYSYDFSNRTGIADTYYAYDPINTPKTTAITIKNPEGTVISGNSVPVYQNEYQLSASASPEGALQRFSWMSSDRNIADVGNGWVSFKKEGSVRITVTALDESNKSAWVDLTLRPKAKSLVILNDAGEKISGKEINFTDPNYQLRVQVTPADALQEVRWLRDDTLASMTSDGKVTFNSYGSITITAKTKDGTDLSTSVKLIYGPPAASVAIQKSDGTDVTGKTITVNTSDYQLKAIASPKESAQIFSWTSSDTATAEVDGNGRVSFKKIGTVTITATAEDGSGKSAYVGITYVPYVSSVSIKNSDGTDVNWRGVIRTTSAVNQLKAVAYPDEAMQKI